MSDKISKEMHGGWTAEFEKCEVEYRRADLPPTPAEAMRCPEVMALVDELHYIVLCLKTIALHSNDERFAGVSRVAWLRLQDIIDSLDTQDQNKATEND